MALPACARFEKPRGRSHRERTVSDQYVVHPAAPILCANHVLKFDPSATPMSLSPLPSNGPAPHRRDAPNLPPSFRRAGTPRVCQPAWNAHPRKKCPATPLPGAHEIEQIRGQINATKREIVWTNTDDALISDTLTSDVVCIGPELHPKRIIISTEPMDISIAPQPAKLISTTALVQDFIGVPGSLAFIR
jgi:hypothetical protein